MLSAVLDQRTTDMDREIVALIEDDPELDGQAGLVRAMPGPGPTVLATLLGELPELGTLGRRRIASLSGLEPHAHESGMAGTRRMSGGLRKVPEAHYLVALGAARRVPMLKTTRGRMKAAGKAPKTILIAVACQFLVILNAMIRNRQPIRT